MKKLEFALGLIDKLNDKEIGLSAKLYDARCDSKIKLIGEFLGYCKECVRKESEKVRKTDSMDVDYVSKLGKTIRGYTDLLENFNDVSKLRKQLDDIHKNGGF